MSPKMKKGETMNYSKPTILHLVTCMRNIASGSHKPYAFTWDGFPVFHNFAVNAYEAD